MTDAADLVGWARFIDQILDGHIHRRPYVRIGPTPPILRKFGLVASDLAITPGKIKRVAGDHPEITREIWRNLPRLLRNPVAIVPSAHRDGSIVPVLALGTSLSGLVLVPILPAGSVAFNLVLSIYERPDGEVWLRRELRIAAEEGKTSFLEKGFAATLPQPGSASEDAIPSSPGSIPADGTAKPKRKLLSLRQKSSEE